jgi:hypothetical protein
MPPAGGGRFMFFSFAALIFVFVVGFTQNPKAFPVGPS